MTNSTINYDNVVELLLREVPELRPLLNEHLDDEFGQLLPHVFFGDLTRYTMQQMTQLPCRGREDAPDVVRRILDFLDRALAAGDERTQELIVASFLENLDRTNPAYQQLTSTMNPHLKHMLHHMDHDDN